MDKKSERSVEIEEERVVRHLAMKAHKRKIDELNWRSNLNTSNKNS